MLGKPHPKQNQIAPPEVARFFSASRREAEQVGRTEPFSDERPREMAI